MDRARTGSWVGEDRHPGSDVLVVVLGVALWLAAGSLVLAVAAGLGEHPGRRLAVGLALVAVSGLALWRRTTVGDALRVRPWLVLPVAAAALAGAAVDGLLDSPYVSFAMTTVALAAVVARAATVWLCVLVLVAGHAGVVALERPPSALAEDGVLPNVLGALLGYPVVALVTLGLVRLFVRYVDRAGATLEALRLGAPGLAPALSRAVVEGRRTPPALDPAEPALTPMERRVVVGLAGGSTPKQLAHRWGLSIATVRTHIRNAKRKTGARTLAELSAIGGRLARERGDAARA